jgi:phosphoribosyl 1,2-cyclic phosphodiesterase
MRHITPRSNRGTRFRIRCWGARGTTPSPGPHTVRYGGHTSCLEVRAADETLLVLDAGTGLRTLGQKLSPDEVAHVFLTHQHSDHVLGLPHFAPLMRDVGVLPAPVAAGGNTGGSAAAASANEAVLASIQRAPIATVVPPAPRVRLMSGTASRGELQALLDTLLSPPLFPPLGVVTDRIAIQSFRGSTPAEVSDRVLVHRFPARHPGDAAILRIDDGFGAAIAFAPDNELDYASADPEVIAWRRGLTLALHGVPILVHDAMYTENELPAHHGWGHSSALEATRFAMECVAGLLVLFHHHPDRSDEAMDALVQECRQLVALSGSSLRVIAAWEGLSLTV